MAAGATSFPSRPVVGFTELARRLGAASRAAGLVVPAFRSPPRLAGADRTIRRLPGGPIVAVRLAGRPIVAVAADMIEGVVRANGLDGQAAVRVRTTLTRAVADAWDAAA